MVSGKLQFLELTFDTWRVASSTMIGFHKERASWTLRRYPESAGTGAYPDCHRKQEGQSLAPPNRPTLGDAVQLLRERSKLGPHVRPPLPLLPLLSARLPESTSLVGAATPGTENRLPAVLQRLPEMQ